MAVLLELKDVAEKQEDATTVAACKACSCLGPPSLLPLGSQDCSLSPAKRRFCLHDAGTTSNIESSICWLPFCCASTDSCDAFV